MAYKENRINIYLYIYPIPYICGYVVVYFFTVICKTVRFFITIIVMMLQSYEKNKTVENIRRANFAWYEKKFENFGDHIWRYRAFCVFLQTEIIFISTT